MKRHKITSQRERLYYGTSDAIRVVRGLVKRKKVPVKELALRESERLDHVAHKYYGDTRLWWVIAAASDIGWGLQCPPGTFLRIPTDLGIISNAL
mgnify:FL=1|tara:strand:- start:1705 stop:1989 length:285 start_codon:yes stop_codon:yes gene_type:complete